MKSTIIAITNPFKATIKKRLNFEGKDRNSGATQYMYHAETATPIPEILTRFITVGIRENQLHDMTADDLIDQNVIVHAKSIYHKVKENPAGGVWNNYTVYALKIDIVEEEQSEVIKQKKYKPISNEEVAKLRESGKLKEKKYLNSDEVPF